MSAATNRRRRLKRGKVLAAPHYRSSTSAPGRELVQNPASMIGVPPPPPLDNLISRGAGAAAHNRRAQISSQPLLSNLIRLARRLVSRLDNKQATRARHCRYQWNTHNKANMAPPAARLATNSGGSTKPVGWLDCWVRRLLDADSPLQQRQQQQRQQTCGAAN